MTTDKNQKNILICFLSGTGNTKKIAQLYKSNLEKLGARVLLFDVEKSFVNNGKKIDLSPLIFAAKAFVAENPPTETTAQLFAQFDILGFGYPVHAFNCPQPFLLFLKALEGLNHTAFVFKTSGEPLSINNGADPKVKNRLKKCGCRTLSFRHIVMPYNILVRHDDRLVKQMWFAAQRIVETDAKDVFGLVEKKVKTGIFNRFNSVAFRIEWGGARLIGRGFRATDKCVGCGKCSRDCPVGNITLKNGKPVFGSNCWLCMRCSFFCPTDAIKIGVLNNWRVNGEYDLDKISSDDKISADYITAETKGIAKIYKKYFLANKSEKSRENNFRDKQRK